MRTRNAMTLPARVVRNMGGGATGGNCGTGAGGLKPNNTPVFAPTDNALPDRAPDVADLAARLHEVLSPPVSRRRARLLAAEILDGMDNEAGAEDIALRLLAVARDFTPARALAIATTEVARIDREGQLDVLEERSGEDAKVRWRASAGACPRCRARNGEVMTVAEARGVLPLHTHCHCRWTRVYNTRNEQTANAAAFFARCQRDAAGRCLPGTGGLAARVASNVRRKAAAKYAKLEARYGRAGAVAVMAGIAATLPAPIPGSSFAVLGIAEGIRAVAKTVQRYRRNAAVPATANVTANAHPQLHAMVAEGHDFVRELHAEHGAELDPRFNRPALHAAIAGLLYGELMDEHVIDDGFGGYPA